MTQLLPPKKEVALALLERSNVDVYLDPRAKGVVVPPQFRKEPRLILKIGLNMPVPIPDLRLDEESMSCTLSFNRSPFYCVVPWSSVFAMVGEDGRGMVWPDDVPQELAVKVVEPSEGAPSGAGELRGAGRLTAADSRGTDSATAGAGTGSPSAPGRRQSASRSNKLAPAEESRESSARAGEPASASSARGKRKKKKEEEGPVARPVLVAVPREGSDAARLVPPSSHEGRAESDRPREIRQPPEAARGRPQAPQPRDGVSAISPPQPARSRPRQPAPVGSPPSHRRPPPSVRPGEGEARPKRELPPYLRVVK